MSRISMTIIWKTSVNKNEKRLFGRNAWAMRELVQSGRKGCTSIDNPAPAWAAYVQNLRGMGFDIETVTEPHGGPFKGHHGRYILRSDVTITDWNGNDCLR